jgi:hypothetical protein
MDSIADAAIRLLSTLSSPKDGRILGPMIVREIIYLFYAVKTGKRFRHWPSATGVSSR